MHSTIYGLYGHGNVQNIPYVHTAYCPFVALSVCIEPEKRIGAKVHIYHCHGAGVFHRSLRLWGASSSHRTDSTGLLATRCKHGSLRKWFEPSGKPANTRLAKWAPISNCKPWCWLPTQRFRGDGPAAAIVLRKCEDATFAGAAMGWLTPCLYRRLWAKRRRRRKTRTLGG